MSDYQPTWSKLQTAMPEQNSNRTEIVFILDNVDDWQTLVDGIRPGIQIEVIDSAQDGLAQMAQFLDGRSGIDAIHILSHGSEGSVQLGALNLTAQNLQDHTADLAAIGRALNANADILLYGCDVAAGSSGAAFVAALAQTTQADIAASSDITGTSLYGGNWILEEQTGIIDSTLPITPEALQAYHYTLPTFDFELGVSEGTGSVSQTVGGVTVTATTDDAQLFTWDTGSDVILYSTTNWNLYLQYTFSQAVDVSSFLLSRR